jgi:hypothetical protein
MTSCTIRAARYDEILAVAAKLPYPVSPNCRAIRNDGAMVIYDGWTPNAVQVHVYSVGPRYLFDKHFLREVFWYPFVQCNKGKLFVVTPASSKESLAVSRALGFRETYRMKDGWDVGVDMVLKEMRKEDCRWIKRTH